MHPKLSVTCISFPSKWIHSKRVWNVWKCFVLDGFPFEKCKCLNLKLCNLRNFLSTFLQVLNSWSSWRQIVARAPDETTQVVDGAWHDWMMLVHFKGSGNPPRFCWYLNIFNVSTLMKWWQFFSKLGFLFVLNGEGEVPALSRVLYDPTVQTWLMPYLSDSAGWNGCSIDQLSKIVFCNESTCRWWGAETHLYGHFFFGFFALAKADRFWGAWICANA